MQGVGELANGCTSNRLPPGATDYASASPAGEVANSWPGNRPPPCASWRREKPERGRAFWTQTVGAGRQGRPKAVGQQHRNELETARFDAQLTPRGGGTSTRPKHWRSRGQTARTRHAPRDACPLAEREEYRRRACRPAMVRSSSPEGAGYESPGAKPWGTPGEVRGTPKGRAKSAPVARPLGLSGLGLAVFQGCALGFRRTLRG